MEYILVVASSLSAIATTVGVILVVIQLLQTNETEMNKFENDITNRFIKISNEISYKIMYLKPNADNFENLVEDRLEGYYKYFDLTNQELFLMEEKRISDETSKEWENGIIELLKLESFKYAWEKITNTIPPNTFTQLRKFINKNK